MSRIVNTDNGEEICIQQEIGSHPFIVGNNVQEIGDFLVVTLMYSKLDIKRLKQGGVESTAPAEPDGELPKDKRVIRTKSTGDRVYLIDETAKTKAWVTSEEILTKLGYSQADVQEVEDSSLVGYAMTASIYKVD